MMSALYHSRCARSMESPAGSISLPASMKAIKSPLALVKPKRTAWPLPWFFLSR